MPKFLSVIFNFLKNIVNEWKPGELEQVLAVCGKAFGPEGIRHSSELTQEERQALLAHVPVLRGMHTDWPAGLNWIPRITTCYIGSPPIRVGGNAPTDSGPIPPKGTWVAWRGYMAMTTASGLHVRFGFRWDDVDQYYEFPSFTVKRV